MNPFVPAPIGAVVLAVLCGWPAPTQTPASPPSANAASPCASRPENGQLDFWVGEWDVTDKGRKIATSSIKRAVEGCIILENYSQADGFQGKSVNFYDAALGKWRQTWVDSLGNVSEFVGEYRDQAMRLEGETHRRDGTKVLRRMTIENVGPDRIRQYSQRSVDGGKTWEAAYDFVYRRRS
jgi:hypothetical protein